MNLISVLKKMKVRLIVIIFSVSLLGVSLFSTAYGVYDLDFVDIDIKNIETRKIGDSTFYIIQFYVKNNDDDFVPIRGKEIIKMQIDIEKSPEDKLRVGDDFYNYEFQHLSPLTLDILFDQDVPEELLECEKLDSTLYWNESMTATLCFEVQKTLFTATMTATDNIEYYLTFSKQANKNSCPDCKKISFLLDDVKAVKKIPDWVKNTFKWFADDLISEDEVINAIQFLIKEGIIKI